MSDPVEAIPEIKELTPEQLHKIRIDCLTDFVDALGEMTDPEEGDTAEEDAENKVMSEIATACIPVVTELVNKELKK